MDTELLPHPFTGAGNLPPASHSPQRDPAALADEQGGLGEVSISKEPSRCQQQFITSTQNKAGRHQPGG